MVVQSIANQPVLTVARHCVLDDSIRCQRGEHLPVERAAPSTAQVDDQIAIHGSRVDPVDPSVTVDQSGPQRLPRLGGSCEHLVGVVVNIVGADVRAKRGEGQA